MFNHKNINIKKIRPLCCDVFENVTVLPMLGDITGQVSCYALGAYANGKPLPQVQRMSSKDTKFFQLPNIEPWNFSNQEVIYGGIFFMHWGHFLLENLQRLWYAKESNLPIVWTGVNGFTHCPSEFKPWQKEIFEALGINNEHIFLNEPTQFAKVHFPEPGSGINTHLHPEHAKFLSSYESTPTKGRYVYFSRSKIRGCANEEQIENMLKKRGWSIVYPENLSVTQQLKALSSAEVCLMIGGSAQHSLLLTKNLQTRFVIIPREHSTTFNLIANSSSDNYFLLNLDKEVLYSDYNDEANDLFTLDMDFMVHILDKTDNFTKNIDEFPKALVKPEQTTLKQINVPDFYYKPLAPINEARKLFSAACFLYKQKKYAEAFAIFKQLQEGKLLEDFMYTDAFNALQQYQIQSNLGISLPLEKYRHQVAQLQEKIKENPQSLRHYKKLTELFLVAGDFSSAITLQTKLTELNPMWSKPLAQLAFIFDVQGQLDLAIEYAKKAVEVEPLKLKRKLELVRYLLKKQDYIACKQIVAESLRINPTWSDGYVQLAEINHKQGELGRAIDCAKRAVDMEPSNIVAKERLAEYLAQNGDNAASIELLAKAMQQNPRLAERYAQNARIYEHKGDLPKAIEYAKKAVELEPRNFVCKAHLAEYLRKNSNYDELLELMGEALHANPFWAEPFDQFARMHDAKGELDKAIDFARKAVAVQPFDASLRHSLEQYRIKNIRMQHDSDEAFVKALNQRHSYIRERIQTYIDKFYAKTYLEIGVFEGKTFLRMDVPFKVAVDPAFRFNVNEFANENVIFYSDTSDDFFEKFKQDSKKLSNKYHDQTFKFDVIFIDGLHTYEQTIIDFENSIPYSHEKTIWIIDDTVPSNCFSAIKHQGKSELWRAQAGLSKSPAWHGDVFKVIFEIHDKYPEYSYCTHVDNGNPQTILWRTEKPTKRKKVFGAQKPIKHMCYEDFLEYVWVMNLVGDSEVFSKIFSNINPLDYKTGEEYKRIIHPLVSDTELEMVRENKNLQTQVQTLLDDYKQEQEEIATIKMEMLNISKLNKTLIEENNKLKKQINGLKTADK